MIQSREPTLAERAGSHKMEIVSLPFPTTQSLESTINNIIHNGITWKFLLQNTEQGSEDLCRNPFREENLWWYRGTAFHLFAIPGIVSSILLDLDANDRHVSEVEWWVNAIRKLWEIELFWPENTPSHKIAEVGLHILTELNVIKINENGQIRITEDENNLEHIYFFADLVRPERELYSLQVTAALDLSEQHGSFTKDALIEKVVEAHRAAFLRGAAMQSAQHSQVFGRRVFDALVHVDIFRASENNSFVVSSEKLSPILYFFESTVWREFLK
jgi:glycerol-3-phosphate O-acyltransferase